MGFTNNGLDANSSTGHSTIPSPIRRHREVMAMHGGTPLSPGRGGGTGGGGGMMQRAMSLSRRKTLMETYREVCKEYIYIYIYTHMCVLCVYVCVCIYMCEDVDGDVPRGVWGGEGRGLCMCVFCMCIYKCGVYIRQTRINPVSQDTPSISTILTNRPTPQTMTSGRARGLLPHPHQRHPPPTAAAAAPAAAAVGSARGGRWGTGGLGSPVKLGAWG